MLAQANPFDLTHTVGFTFEQKLWLLGAWVVFFLIPALALRAHAKKRGHDWKRWFFLTLVASVLGPIEYWEHVAVQKRRAKRREAAATRERDGPSGDATRTGSDPDPEASGASDRSP